MKLILRSIVWQSIKSEKWPDWIHTSRLKQYLNFWKISMNSCSGGGRAFAVSKSSGIQKWWYTKDNSVILTHTCVISIRKSYFCKYHLQKKTFYLQSFAFYFSFYFSSSDSAPLLPLPSAAAWPWSPQCPQNSDWGFPEEGRTLLLCFEIWNSARGDWKDTKIMRRRTTSLSARRSEISGPPFTVFAAREERRGFSSSIFIRGPGFCWIWKLSPILPLIPKPLINTNTQSNLCAPEPFTFNTSNLVSLFFSLPFHRVKSSCHVQIKAFLTSGSRIRWRVGWWRVWSMCNRGIWDIIGFHHPSSTWRKPDGWEKSFNPPTLSQHCILFVSDGSCRSLSTITGNALERGLRDVRGQFLNTHFDC